MSAPIPKSRVLLAEDVRAISLRVTHFLQNRGYEVEVAKDGEECIAMVAAQRPGLVLLDVMMPRLNGIEVLKLLRSNPTTSDLPVIICTASDWSDELEQARRIGITDVIVKPFENDTLLQKVDACFNRSCEVTAPTV